MSSTLFWPLISSRVLADALSATDVLAVARAGSSFKLAVLFVYRHHRGEMRHQAASIATTEMKVETPSTRT